MSRQPSAGTRWDRQVQSAAIRLAAEEAGYRGAELIAVMAYSGERALGAPAVRPVAILRTADEERTVAEAALRDAAPCPVLVVPEDRLDA